MRHPFIRRAKRNNILIELLERSADYRLHMGPSSDSDQDDDTISQSGRSEWEYPTVKSNIGNYETIKVVPNTPPVTQIKSNSINASPATLITNGVSIISINGSEKNDINNSYNYQYSIPSLSTSSSSNSTSSSLNRLSIDNFEQIKKETSNQHQNINKCKDDNFVQPNESIDINYYSNNANETKNIENKNNSQRQTHSVRLKY